MFPLSLHLLPVLLRTPSPCLRSTHLQPYGTPPPFPWAIHPTPFTSLVVRSPAHGVNIVAARNDLAPVAP